MTRFVECVRRDEFYHDDTKEQDMNQQDDPKPSPLLDSMLQQAGLKPDQPVTAHVSFLKVVFDLQDEKALKTTILFRIEDSDGKSLTQARSCTVEKKYSPMDVMAAIAAGDIPPVWEWPTLEEGFV